MGLVPRRIRMKVKSSFPAGRRINLFWGPGPNPPLWGKENVYYHTLSATSSVPHMSWLNECCSVAQLCLVLFNPMDCSTPGFPVLHHLPKLAQTHIHWVSDAIQPFHPLLSPSPPAFNVSQHQLLFQWISSLHQVAKVLELQHQSFQWVFRVDL